MRFSTSKAATVLGLGAALTLTASGVAWAFPKPKYPATQSDAQAADQSSASQSSKPASSAKSSTKAKATAKTAAVTSSQLPAARPAPGQPVLQTVAERTPPTPAQTPVQTPAAKAPAAIPAKPSEGSKGWSVYLVQKGDTLSGVGRRFGDPLKTLADLNELDPKAALKAGMKLKLPPGSVDSGKDPYAAGPSPFSLDAAAPSHASSARPKPIKTSLTEPAPTAPAASSHAAASGTKPKPIKASLTEPAPVASSEPLASSRPTAQPPVSTPRPAAVATRPAPSKETAAAPDAPMPLRAAPIPKTQPAQVATSSAPMNEAPPSDPALASGRGRFAWPLKGDVLSRFGPMANLGQRNDGVNIAGEDGADVRAAAAGEVVYAGSDVKGYGNVVLIMHPNGWDTVYAHLGSIKVRMRDHVTQGQTIGTVGRTGGVDQPQLHFETRFSAAAQDKHKPVDPLTLLP